jgi:hypothetical protein
MGFSNSGWSHEQQPAIDRKLRYESLRSKQRIIL